MLEGTILSDIYQFLSSNISEIRPYNPQITNPDIIDRNSRVNVPFSCGCAGNGDFLSHEFDYTIESNDTYKRIAETYANLTTVDTLNRFNSDDPNNLQVGARLNVPVNCSCGNEIVSKDYGLFITYPIRPGENLFSVASQFGLPEELLSDYNPNLNFSSGSGLAFIPGKGDSFHLTSQKLCLATQFQALELELSTKF